MIFALSLHAPDDELRDRKLIPVNSPKWKVDEALDAAFDYYVKTGRRVSIEYALIKDMNDQRVACRNAREKSTPVAAAGSM